MIYIKASGDGFYIVEEDGDFEVLYLSGGEWYDYATGSYATYDINPTRIIEKIVMPLKEIEE